ncbi:PAS domain-containing sensor histidine kinase [Lysobacter sp. MMG2]|uniref:PAS domain-containing sensor histidine kinase n=1 Tax=Lysobacter sp. MMG2 TaxID=2801338 RepID=UPI001C22B829|nr:PAS domain-containing sensor histidine kinase [Lysobacter sp. MMG2]MBU8977523.1 PAS domain-containing sensor histidine kinase [Lysobacter sp. MMG2]
MDTHALRPMVDEQVIKDMLWAFAVRSPEHAALLLSEEGEVSWTNAGAEIILGAAPGGLVGMNMARFFLRRDANAGIPEHERVEARHRGTASDDRWMARLDRSRFWASGVTVHLGGEVPSCTFLKLFRDLTEVKMQMESSRERCRAATEASEGKSAAIALLAHELRNPLSGISLGMGVLQRRCEGVANINGAMEAIERNVTLAARLIDDLMHHSKVHADGFCLERSRCNLRELLEASSDIARRQMEQDDRTLRVLVPRGDIEVRVDRMRMQQVFVNLIANALRYTPVPGRIWVSGTLEGSEVIVRVSDEGVGIASERLERLFEMFTLSRMETSKLGLGLGLALVKKIVELHGGSVQARSEGPGKGSQFVVRFPAHD